MGKFTFESYDIHFISWSWNIRVLEGNLVPMLNSVDLIVNLDDQSNYLVSRDKSTSLRVSDCPAPGEGYNPVEADWRNSQVQHESDHRGVP